MKKVKLFLSFANKNNGFSFIETLVSLLIISIISTVMYLSFSSSIKEIIKIKEKEKLDYQIFRSEQIIRNTISSIDIPFWKRDFYFFITEDSISCNYQNGNNKIETKKLPYSIKILSYEIIYFEKTNPVGIRIEFEMDNRIRIINQVFASRPIGLYVNE